MNDLTQGSVYEFNNSLFLKGDFIGFTFDGIHSSELGIVRVSGGDRYEEALVPSLSLKTTNVPGGDGSYYFGTNYTQRNINLQIAFDSLTQQQFMRLISVFGTKKISTLIFDENPYKVYNVKISSEPKLNYICFDEDNKRIYKGEDHLPALRREREDVPPGPFREGHLSALPRRGTVRRQLRSLRRDLFALRPHQPRIGCLRHHSCREADHPLLLRPPAVRRVAP